MLVAGGKGERVANSSSDEPKQFRSLGNKRVFEWSLDTLAAFGCSPVIAVFPTPFLSLARELIAAEDVDVVPGGHTRQASVAAGLERVESEFVVIHDAVRPFVTEHMIASVTEPLEEFDGAVTALPMNETVKRIEGERDILHTVDRTGLWRSQTPQAFRTSVLKRAHRRAAADRFVSTDDAQLLERYGGRVVVVPGDPVNVKLTYPEDFLVAEAIAARLGSDRS